MNIFAIKDMKPPAGKVATFSGFEDGANVSFLLVQFSAGEGPSKHRHPYEETFIILNGGIEFIVDGKTQLVESGTTAIVPTGTWHEFKNRSDQPPPMANIRPVRELITAWA